jgi:hypothetical protein
MAKELEKTLKVNGEEYNINAKQAEKVEKALKLKKNLLTTISEDTFDGTAEKVIDYVSAEGGAFRGAIRVPNNENANIDNKAVLNYYDLKNSVLKELKNNSVLYTWNGKTLAGGGEGDLIKSVSIITGDTGDVNSFAAKNFTTKQFSAYIYIGDTGSIYFGTSDSSDVAGVTVSAENAINANQLTEARELSVNLESDSAANFDGTEDVAIGVSGTLPVSKGGTGEKDLKDVTVGSANILISTETGKMYNADGISAAIDSLNNVIDGTTTVGKATKATQDSNGNTISSYYQPKILMGTADPTTSTVSAVKNAPNGAIYIKY